MHLRPGGGFGPLPAGPGRRHDPAADAVQRHRVRGHRAGLLGRAGAVERRSLLPDAGHRLARARRRALPRQRVAALQPPDAGRAVLVQGAERAAHLGRHPGRAPGRGGGRRAGVRAGHRWRDGGADGDEPRLRSENRGRGPLRGLHPVPVPGLGAEEPEPLAVRGGDGARVRGGRPIGDQLHPGRVRARAQRAACRPGPAAVPPGPAADRGRGQLCCRDLGRGGGARGRGGRGRGRAVRGRGHTGVHRRGR